MKPDLEKLLNRVAKWRMVFASWQLGVSSMSNDGDCQAVRHHREATIMLRIEVSALAKLLIQRGHFSKQEWEVALMGEAEALDAAFERLFPGFQSSDEGMILDVEAASKTMEGWPP